MSRHLSLPERVDSLLTKSKTEQLGGSERTQLRQYLQDCVAGAGNSSLKEEVQKRTTAIRAVLGLRVPICEQQDETIEPQKTIPESAFWTNRALENLRDDETEERQALLQIAYGQCQKEGPFWTWKFLPVAMQERNAFLHLAIQQCLEEKEGPFWSLRMIEILHPTEMSQRKTFLQIAIDHCKKADVFWPQRVLEILHEDETGERAVLEEIARRVA